MSSPARSATLRAGAFLLLCLAQLAVPAMMIVRYERTLAAGAPYRFRTAPVDPADPFRGRYVTLSFDEERLPATRVAPACSGRHCWAVLSVDEAGFARIVNVGPDRPLTGDAIEVDVRWRDDEDASLGLPFDRYYLDEALAPRAEAAYLRMASDRQYESFVTVRVHDGHAALEELYLDGVAVREYLEREPPPAE